MIECGLPADWVYRAATLNAATRIGRPDLGLVAPGKRADIVLLGDLQGVVAKAVVADGALVAEGASLKKPVPATAAPALMSSVDLKDLSRDDFEVRCDTPEARIATLSKPRFPEWGDRTVHSSSGKLLLPDDMIRMAIVNRYGRNTPVRVAFLENWGTWRGAFATTVSHDSHNLTVFGRNPDDMAVAANAVCLSDGGMAVVSEGKVQAQISLPLAGLVSEASLSQVAHDFATIRSALDSLVDWNPPYLVPKALFGASLVCNAGPRLSDVGLVDVFEGLVLTSSIQS